MKKMPCFTDMCFLGMQDSDIDTPSLEIPRMPAIEQRPEEELHRIPRKKFKKDEPDV